MPVLARATREIMELNGAASCAIVDIETGECLARAGVAVAGTLEAAGLVNARMLRAKLRMVQDQHHESIEDVLITLDRHYHIIRLIHCGAGMPCMFIYLVLDKAVANLAMARRKLAELEHEMVQSPESSAQLESARIRALTMDAWSNDKVYGGNGFAAQDDSDLPPFMRDDVAMKLLGIVVDEEARDD